MVGGLWGRCAAAAVAGARPAVGLAAGWGFRLLFSRVLGWCLRTRGWLGVGLIRGLRRVFLVLGVGTWFWLWGLLCLRLLGIWSLRVFLWMLGGLGCVVGVVGRGWLFMRWLIWRGLVLGFILWLGLLGALFVGLGRLLTLRGLLAMLCGFSVPGFSALGGAGVEVRGVSVSVGVEVVLNVEG